MRITVGGDKLTYPFDSGSPAANMVETNLLVNSVISDAPQGAKFMPADIKDYFLATPMARSEYMKVRLKYFPAGIIVQYNLHNLVAPDAYIYIKIKKGMYGLK